MKKTSQTLFKDTVIKGIYHVFVFENNAYFMNIDVYGTIIKKALGTDKKSASQSFHFFNMIFCGYYDTHGFDAYLDAVDKYLEANVTRRLSQEEIKQYQ